MDAAPDEPLLDADFEEETTESVDLQLDLICRAAGARVQAAVDEFVDRHDQPRLMLLA